jgi:hypothetical protein
MTFSNLTRMFEAGFSARYASILINNGAISVLANIMSTASSGKQVDVVYLACNCLQKLASARVPDECAASAAVAVLKCALIPTLAALVAPLLPPSESPKIVKSKSSRFINIGTAKLPASVAGAAADAAVSKAPAASSATAAACAVIRTWFSW